jgi:hypothetical protein
MLQNGGNKKCVLYLTQNASLPNKSITQLNQSQVSQARMTNHKGQKNVLTIKTR